ncbi:helix-turn-helix domain-containing protein [Nocardia thailandica]|uniref:AraC-like ligand-binding domain-containing protein n=1 Tax=Nocardia thailandica TaxID=257275 RepID=UPI00031D4F0A|nr:helix-turn-helix domain-containing protein [Nocardia thailandica]
MGGHGPAEYTVRSDEDTPVAEAFGQWEAALSAGYVPLSVRPAGSPDFRGSIVSGDLGALHLSTVSSVAQRVRRARAELDRTSGEYLLAGIYTRGTSRLNQDGRTAFVRPGEMVLCDTTRPFAWDVEDEFSQVVVRVPLDRLRAEPGIEDLCLPTAVTIAQGSAAAVVARFFLELARIHRTAPEEARVLAADGVKLLASAVQLASGQRPVEAVAHAVTREQVLTFMRRHCTDPDLTVDDIARGCLLSRRSLYRLFGESGEGLGAILRHMRLEHARQLLLRDRDQSATAVAAASGFASERHFFRAFRLETGMTPGEFRLLGGPSEPVRRVGVR